MAILVLRNNVHGPYRSGEGIGYDRMMKIILDIMMVHNF